MSEYGNKLMNKWLNGQYQITQLPGKAAPSTRKYYATHQGYDYATPQGTPVVAKTVGEVIFAGYDPSGWGNRVGVYEPSTNKTTYLSHLSDIKVKKGQKIGAGTLLGLTGGMPGSRGSGNTTGAHLDITEYIGNKVASALSSGASSAKAYAGGYNFKDVLNRARSKYGKKLVAFSTNPERLKKSGIKGKIIRL